MSPSTDDKFRLDRLIERWWTALEAAQSALQAATPYLDAREVREYGRRLTEQRGTILQLLEGLPR